MQAQRTRVSRLDSTLYCKKHNAPCGPNELIKLLHLNTEEDNQSEQIFKKSLIFNLFFLNAFARNGKLIALYSTGTIALKALLIIA